MFKKFVDKIVGGNVLYYPGCLTKVALPDIQKKYEEILRQVGVSFMMIADEEFCCGSPVIKAGYKADFKKLKEKNLAIFAKFNIKKIITNCPACYNIFKEHYNFPVQHITQVLIESLNKISVQNSKKEEITYHDPCHLGRYSGIYNEPRKILKKLGYQVVELSGCKDKSRCCGAGGGMKTNNPKMSNQIAKNILSQVKTDKLVSPCPLCYLQFKENASSALKVYELSELI